MVKCKRLGLLIKQNLKIIFWYKMFCVHTFCVHHKSLHARYAYAYELAHTFFRPGPLNVQIIGHIKSLSSINGINLS